MKHIQNTKMSICSEEVGSYTGRRSIGESAGTIAETVERQRLVETIVRSRPQSPPPMESSVHDATDSVNSNITEHINGSNEFRKKSCELKRPIQFATTTLDDIQKAQLKSVENSVPQKWESPLLQALTTVSNDVFSQIPSKKSATPLASALAIAPSEPFNPVSATTLELIPLPAETIPYLPPEHPVFDKSNNEMKNQHSKDDTTGKEQIRSKKKKDMKDKYLEDLPKPQEKLSMLEALTTASERSYSPLIINTITMDESEEEFVVQNRKMGTADGKQMKNEEILEKEHLRKIETSEKKQVQKSSKSATESQTIQTSSVDEHKSGAQMLPIFQGFSCSFHNKTDHSEFQVQISTTPPVPHVVVESQDRAIFEERSVTKTITEESDTQEQSSTIEKQSEEIILKRPLPMTALHKPQGLPQYQVNLSDSIEADLKLAEKIETAQSRHDEKKHKIERENNVQNVKCVQQPIITIEPGDSTLTQSQNSFKPIIDNRPPSTTSSTRPRTLTPSMINKPSSILPYYQANLVAQKYSAPMVNLLDPKSPNISRSPSPCPENMSCTLAPENMSSIRPKSPAEGPPPNPLESSKSILSREGFQVDRAKKNLTEFIPQYKNKRDLIEDIYGKHTTRDDYQGSDSQAYSSIEQGVIYTSEAHVQNIPAAIEVAVNEAVGLENISRQNITEQSQQCKLIKGQQSHVQTSECSEDIQSTVSISQKCQSQDLEEFRKSQTESIQQSNDGLKQIHRKKLVTEEFEHTQRSGEMTIEKNVTTTKKYPFNDTNNPIIESQGIIGLHVTAPHPISSPFLKSKSSVTDIQKSSSCQSSQKSSSVCNSTNFEKQIALSQEASTKQIQPQTLNPKMPTPKFDATQLPIHKVVPSEQPIEQRTIVPSKPIKHVSAPGSSQSNQDVKKSNIPLPNTGTSGGRQTGAIGISPKRGRGVLNAAALGGNRVPLCGQCHNHIRGPFITALGKIWCPDHFICATPSCRRPLHDLGFVEEHGKLFCEFCFEQYLAPPCSKCNSKIKGIISRIPETIHYFFPEKNQFRLNELAKRLLPNLQSEYYTDVIEFTKDCLKAIGKVFHPECFNCVHCGKLFGNSPFFIENGSPYCDVDWNELFTTKCFACGFPVEAGDRWVEALNNNYHSQCFNCTMCKKNLEGQSFFAKGGRPFCKNHAR